LCSDCSYRRFTGAHSISSSGGRDSIIAGRIAEDFAANQAGRSLHNQTLLAFPNGPGCDVAAAFAGAPASRFCLGRGSTLGAVRDESMRGSVRLPGARIARYIGTVRWWWLASLRFWSTSAVYTAAATAASQHHGQKQQQSSDHAHPDDRQRRCAAAKLWAFIFYLLQ
jgi:hypothetical protein